MSTTKRKIFAALLLSWAGLHPAFGQGPVTPGTATLDPGTGGYGANPGVGVMSPYPYGDYVPSATPSGSGPSVPSYAGDPAYSSYVPYDPWGFRAMTRSDIGTGLGYERGYQSFGSLLPIPVTPGQSLFFLQTRGIVGYDGTNGFNGGAGFRWYNPDLDRVYGVSGWFDYDDRRANDYQQWGFSAESLGTFLDFRVNGYFPTNTDQRALSKIYTGEVFFVNHNVGLGQRTVVQEALRGGDAEVGGALPGLGDFGLRGYVGGYYYNGEGLDSGDVVGFKGRLEALITEDLWVQLGVTDDKFFGTNTTMAVTMFLPDGSPSRILSRQPTQERLYYPVDRSYRVAVHEHVLADPELAINPRTGLPFIVDHVNNTAAGGGNGSFENPYSTLPGAPPAATDIIFVNAGDGTSTGMNGGIVLSDFQRLLGDGIPHFITATQGTFELPGDRSLVTPVITNLAGDAVTLANNNEVSGFRIQAPAGNGVFGSGIINFNINNVNITDAGANGIQLLDVSNDVGITNRIDRVSVMNSTLNGIEINNSLGNAANVSLNEIDVRNNQVGVELIADNASTLNVDLNTIQASQNSVGVEIVSNNASLVHANGTAITANSNTATGFEVHSSGGTVDLNLTASSFLGNGTNGLLLEGLNLGTITAILEANNFSSNVNNGLFALADNSTINLQSTDDIFDLNLQNGLHAVVDHTGTLNAAITGGSFSNNDGRGMYVVANNLSTLSMIVTNSTFISNNIAGAEIGLNSGSATPLFPVGLAFQGNTFRDNDGVGFGLNSIDSVYNLAVGGPVAGTDGNIFDNNVGAAIAINQVGTGTGTLLVQNNTITRTRNDADATDDFFGDAINVRLNGTNANNQLTNSLIDGNIIGSLTDATLGNAGRGISVYLEDFTTIANLTVSSNIIGNSGDNGLEFRRFGNAVVDTIQINDNIVSNSGANALRTLPTGNGMLIVAAGSNVDALLNPLVDDYTANANQFINNTNDGVHLRTASDAVLQADLTQNVITGNGGDGIETTEQANSPLDQREVRGTWTGNDISNNGGHGLALHSNKNLVIGQNGAGLGNTITNNTGNGVDITGTGTVVLTNNLISNNTFGVNYDGFVEFGHFITLDNNLIIDNRSDGIELRATSNVFMSVVATRNVIANNAGRGVDILNQFEATSFIQFGDGTANGGNVIEGNGLEGFYVVNTSSETQDQVAAAESALAADGLINVDPDVVLDLQFNRIQGNGGLSNFIGTGFVLRVGTSASGAGLGSTGLFGNGRVNARLLNNEFGGNFGEDVYVQSFTSTVDPITSAGTWNAGDADPAFDDYEPDPLARLNMVFEGNTGDSATVVTNGLESGTLAAYYDNADDFKSRQFDATPPGPFFDPAGTARRRNAERLPLDMNIPLVATTYQYPGMGAFTFQVETGSTTAGFAAGTQFTDLVGMVPPSFFGEQPYGWTTGVAAGTFTFLIP